MGARTSGREAALQMTYALDGVAEPDLEAEQVIKHFWRELPGDVEGRDYADELVRGVADARDRIDDRIRAASRHWRIERMSRVDRNILRLGVFELRERHDVPRPVVIDEAVELAKRYGAEGSSVFVNGVLDRIADDLGR
ncbi:MAG: transcription antitermination factor NusB [Deltaproteobacteria bacterium]|nr:transcription antitermination factor NusB [Deltaproteobacteria bacterium]